MLKYFLADRFFYSLELYNINFCIHLLHDDSSLMYALRCLVIPGPVSPVEPACVLCVKLSISLVTAVCSPVCIRYCTPMHFQAIFLILNKVGLPDCHVMLASAAVALLYHCIY